MSVTLFAQTRDARLQAVIDDADLGSGPAMIEYFTAANAPATPGGAPVGAPTVQMILAKPCGSVAAHKLSFTQDDPTGDLIASTGVVTVGRLVAGDGHIVLQGDITDDSGTGFFRIEGTGGTTLYAGGRSILGLVEIT